MTDTNPGGPAPQLGLQRKAKALLADMDDVTPADGDAMRALFLERGWVEAVEYFAAKGMFGHAGVVEAGKLLDASREWLRDQTSGDCGPDDGRGMTR